MLYQSITLICCPHSENELFLRLHPAECAQLNNHYADGMAYSSGKCSIELFSEVSNSSLVTIDLWS